MNKPTLSSAKTAGKNIRNDLTPKLEIVERKPKDLKTSKKKVREIRPQHVKKVAASIQKFGFTTPVLISSDEIVDGHIRVAAARSLGIEAISCIDVSHLNDDEIRLLRIALNKSQENGIWDASALKLEFEYQLEINGDLSVTGFEAWEIDNVLEIDTEPDAPEPVDDFGALPDPDADAVTQLGDFWQMRDHLIVCANARSKPAAHALVGSKPVRLVFTDPPYNVPIAGHVSSSGTHAEFHEAVGEMTSSEHEDLLVSALGNAALYLVKGGLVYSFMDWRHMDEMSSALGRIGLQKIQLCVWAKEYPGMGSFYRSEHELVFIAKKPGASHCNNIELGAHGRNRSNVWRFPGATGGKRDDVDDFKVHPTVKPVRLIEEALLDVTGPGDYVLDPFLGSGSTLLAAERTQRRALGIEISPAYIDVAIRRWQDMTGEDAVHVGTGQTFAVREAAKSHGPSDEEGF